MDEKVAASWNAEYANGRYRGEPPVRFVEDILTAAGRHQLTRGLYVGCGNGRNLIPLLDAGLDLIGLDISTNAIAQLRRRRPDRTGDLLAGDLNALPASARYDLVVGIQVFTGSKTGLNIHFFTADELRDVIGTSFTEEVPLRSHRTPRTPPGHGKWSQWEAIWQQRPPSR